MASNQSKTVPDSSTMRWVQHHHAKGADHSHLLSRSGHSAVLLKGNKGVLLFGGLMDKTFLRDCLLFDLSTNSWIQPPVMTSSSDSSGEGGPAPRAFHCGASNASGNMFIFGGRHGRRRLADFWMLDTETWQWVELPCTGDLPSARDFATMVAFEGLLVLHGGWDGNKFLSDTYVLDTSSLEWKCISTSGAVPAPRCGHSATIVENRMLIFGGRGAGGGMLGDLWALRDFAPSVRGNESASIAEHHSAAVASWTQLKLPGAAPSGRCGHAAVSSKSHVLVFGGHSQEGWLTRVDTYLSDCTILDRSTVHWKCLSLRGSTVPAPRAYHSLTRIDQRYLCVGGFDGKTTYGDTWWLLPADDPVAMKHEEMERRGNVLRQATANLSVTHDSCLSVTHDTDEGTAALVPRQPLSAAPQGRGQDVNGQPHDVSPADALLALKRRLGLEECRRIGEGESGSRKEKEGRRSWVAGDHPEESQERRSQLEALGQKKISDTIPVSMSLAVTGPNERSSLLAAARHHLALSPFSSLTLSECAALFDDYRYQVAVAHWRLMSQQDLHAAHEEMPACQLSSFYHLQSYAEMKTSEVAALQLEYKKLLLANEEPSETSGN